MARRRSWRRSGSCHLYNTLNRGVFPFSDVALRRGLEGLTSPDADGMERNFATNRIATYATCAAEEWFPPLDPGWGGGLPAMRGSFAPFLFGEQEAVMNQSWKVAVPALAVLALCGCIDDSMALGALRDESYTNIQLGRNAIGNCPIGNRAARLFTAMRDGREVEGRVCCSASRNCTIRTRQPRGGAEPAQAEATTVQASKSLPNPCEGIPCSGHGRCVVVRGEPACACEEGYTTDATGINCLAVQP